jgi:AP-1 complex subunit mu
MSYRLDIKVKPLFSVDVVVETPSTTKIRFLVKVKSNYKEKSIANNVDLYVPIPEDV